MTPSEVTEWVVMAKSVLSEPMILVTIVYVTSPVMSYLYVQQLKKFLPTMIGRRLTDIEVRGIAWILCFLFAFLSGSLLFGLATSKMAIHGFMIAVVYERAIKFLFKWAEANNPVLLATLRNDRRSRDDPVTEDRKKNDDTSYTRY